VFYQYRVEITCASSIKPLGGPQQNGVPTWIPATW
jgi:hypothetical protein